VAAVMYKQGAPGRNALLLSTADAWRAAPGWGHWWRPQRRSGQVGSFDSARVEALQSPVLPSARQEAMDCTAGKPNIKAMLGGQGPWEEGTGRPRREHSGEVEERRQGHGGRGKGMDEPVVPRGMCKRCAVWLTGTAT